MSQWVEKFPPLNLYNYPDYPKGSPYVRTHNLELEYIEPKWKLAEEAKVLQQFVGEVKGGGVTSATGVKHDSGKPMLDLLDPLALEGLAAVLTFGAKKYAAHNWRGGISYSRLIAALLRHLFAIGRGEDLDKESGLPHIDHVGCCWMFLSNMMKTRKDLDDRFKPKLDK